jgi:hypothetical protein
MEETEMRDIEERERGGGLEKRELEKGERKTEGSCLGDERKVKAPEDRRKRDGRLWDGRK